MNIAFARALNRDSRLRTHGAAYRSYQDLPETEMGEPKPKGPEMKSEDTLTLHNWMEFWKTSNNYFENTSDLEQAELWNGRWCESPNDGSGRTALSKNQKRMEEILKMLGEAGFNAEGARVLDIGSGAGAAALPLARAGAKVTALDISNSALTKLKLDAEKENLSIETIEASWWSADIDKLGLRGQFDLVFVSSTPAVKDVESFDRMMSCSRKLCYFGFHIRNGAHMQMDFEEIFMKILKREPRGMTFGKGSMFINAFVYLYLTGFHPQIRIRHYERKTAMPWEEAADQTIDSLERVETLADTEKKKIRKHYQSSAVDNKYHAKKEGYSGMMVWEVNSKHSGRIFP